MTACEQGNNKRPVKRRLRDPKIHLHTTSGLHPTYRHEYAEGYTFGVEWAQADRAAYLPAAEELSRLREEAETSKQRWSRAFYLGALRGYREITRTQLNGRWGT